MSWKKDTICAEYKDFNGKLDLLRILWHIWITY